MNEGDTVEVTVEEYGKTNGKSASITLKVVKKATENVRNCGESSEKDR